MTQSIPQAQVDAATAYETLMVPALFGEWAPRVADAGQIRPADRVLDVACGTGILAREAASRTRAEGSVVGVDPVLGMLEVAKGLEPRVKWREAVAESLPFRDESFDVVVSQFGLMFFRDRHDALHEILRVLRPEGRLAVAVWDSLEHNPAYADEVRLVERLAGVRAADAIRLPFVLGNRDELVTLFTAAGVADVAVETGKGKARFPSVRTMVEADLRGWLPLMDINLPEEQIEAILQEAEKVLDRYVARDGAASFVSSAHIVTGRRPQRAGNNV